MVLSYRYGTLDDTIAIIRAIDNHMADVSKSWNEILEIEPDAIHEWYHKFLETGGAMLLAVDEEILAGGLALTIRKLHYAKNLVMRDEGFFVTPQYRKTNVARNLIKWAITTAESQKVPLLLGFDSGRHIALMDRFYKSCGLRPMGGLYMKFPTI